MYVTQVWIGSNLVDVGRERCVSTCFGVENSQVGFGDLPGDQGEVLRGSRGEAAGIESGSSFIERITVNMGTVLVWPLSWASGLGVRLGASTADRSRTGRSRPSTPSCKKPGAWGRAAAVSRMQ